MAWRAEPLESTLLNSSSVPRFEVAFFVGVDVFRARKNYINTEESEESVEGTLERKHDKDDGGGSRRIKNSAIWSLPDGALLATSVPFSLFPPPLLPDTISSLHTCSSLR